jgi:nucleoside-diphosphate-sugar epimerase
MRIFVSGGTGFIGTRIVEQLVLGCGMQARVTVRDYRKAIRIGRLAVEWVDGARARPAQWPDVARGCDAVVCCAHPFSSARESIDAVDIARAAAAAAAATTSRRLVFISSAAVFPNGPLDIDDATTPAPDTPYGRIKLRCEQILRAEHAAGGIRVVVLRPSIVYGPFSPSWTTGPALRMKTGRCVLPLGATGICNAVYVDDVAGAAAQAVTCTSTAFTTINISGPDHRTWRTFYGHYEPVVRPGSVEEWPLERINAELAATRRDQTGWSALRRAVRDPGIRNCLNEIPILARLNRAGKSLGWHGLPRVDAAAPMAGDPGMPLNVHLPDRMLLDLYLRAPYIASTRVTDLLGVVPRPLDAGMPPTLNWLDWAGLAARPAEALSA